MLADAARAALLKDGYDPAYGARPLRRLVEALLSEFGRLLLAGLVPDAATVHVVLCAEQQGDQDVQGSGDDDDIRASDLCFSLSGDPGAAVLDADVAVREREQREEERERREAAETEAERKAKEQQEAEEKQPVPPPPPSPARRHFAEAAAATERERRHAAGENLLDKDLRGQQTLDAPQQRGQGHGEEGHDREE